MMEEEQDNINVKRNISQDNNLEPVLISVEKTDPSSCIHIDKDEFKIGRGRTNDEIIAHVSISRQHCVFKRVENVNKWTIKDTSSSGTFLNRVQLPHGETKDIKFGDLIQLGPMSEFLYKFETSYKNEPMAKRPRISVPEIDLNEIVIKQRTFEESQQIERDNLAEQMKASHIEQTERKNQLEKLLADRAAELGEKDHLNRQISVLQKNIEDGQLAEMNLEKLNKELSERLDKERQEFETKLNEEKKKMEEALEISRKEKEMLENNMREQLEKLKEEQQIECKKLAESLTEEKKAAEKFQNEKAAVDQKLKEMADAFSKSEAKIIELQQSLEQQNALKVPQVVALGTVAENVEIVGESNLTILDTIDLTVDAPVAKKAAESTSVVNSTTEDVYNKVGDIMDEQLTCSICSELFVTALTLNCTHTFCQYCINTWMKKKKDCPVCRTAITAMNRSLVLDNFIDKMVENLSAEYKKRRAEIVDERRESEKRANEAANQGGGRKGRGRRAANANPNANRAGNAPAVATSGANTSGNNPGRTERTDGIQHRGPQARNNPDWNNASGSSNQLQQQPATTGSTSNYQQTTAAADSSAQQTDDDDEHDDASDWSTSTDADGDTASVPSDYSNSQYSEDPEGHVTDLDVSMESDGHTTDDSWGAIAHGMDDDFWDEQQDEDYVEGLPGAPYGGYGACYNCGSRGHWSPGCPYR